MCGVKITIRDNVLVYTHTQTHRHTHTHIQLQQHLVQALMVSAFVGFKLKLDLRVIGMHCLESWTQGNKPIKSEATQRRASVILDCWVWYIDTNMDMPWEFKCLHSFKPVLNTHMPICTSKEFFLFVCHCSRCKENPFLMQLQYKCGQKSTADMTLIRGFRSLS